jgi:hypothetical protein
VFDDYLSKYHAQRLSKAVQVGRSLSFVINTTNRVRHVYANRVLFAGEAGRMCNPATGEGISFAMESGWLAAEAVIQAYRYGGGADEKPLEGYRFPTFQCHDQSQHEKFFAGNDLEVSCGHVVRRQVSVRLSVEDNRIIH